MSESQSKTEIDAERSRVAQELERHQHDLPDRLMGDIPAVRALLAALVDSSDDAIIAKDLDGTILSWNRSAERIFGYRGEEVIGLPITILIPEDRRDEEATILATLRRGERIDHFETERIRKDGRRIEISASISPIRDESGAIVAMAKIARDITAGRQAQDAQATLAAIVASSDDAIIGKTLNGIIVAWNVSATRMFGYAADEVLGRSIFTLIPLDRHHEEREIVATLRGGNRIEHFETERVTKDGRRIAVSISVSPIKDSSGEIVGAAKIARDITARRAVDAEREALLQRERAARSEAEAANRSKDAFLATISHELRTPLSPIIAWARMLRDGILGAEKSAKAIATIERSAHTLAQLIDDLLDVSRIIAGKMRLERRLTDVGAVIQAALDVVRPAADAKGIRLLTSFDTPPDSFLADPDRLQQVVWNLLSNAIKFTPEHGQVEILVMRTASDLAIAVRDSGQGFSDAFRPYLFDRFRQADSSVTRMYGGLGLGLAIVRHIVELHGGTVSAESPGEQQGSTFTVHLPLRRSEPVVRSVGDPAPPPGDPPPSNARVLASIRVLVVDDEPDSNEVIATILTLCGADVRVAGSVAQALEVLTHWPPDLVVSDIGMPAHDGYSLVAAMRRDAALARIPAIALTAYATREDRLRILAAGFQLHLTKPVDREELVASVVNVATMLRKR